MSVKVHYPAFLGKKQRELSLGGVALGRDRHFLRGTFALQIRRSREAFQDLVHGLLNTRVGAMELARRLSRELAQLVTVLNAVESAKDLV